MAKRKFNKIKNKDATFNEAFNQFIEEKEALNLSQSTIDNYYVTFDKVYNFFECTSDTLVKDFDLQMIFQWINDMWANDLRPQSVNHHLRNMRAFFNWCFERRIIDERIKIQEVQVQENLPKMYEDEEIMKLLDKPGRTDSFRFWRSWAVISTIYATGLRASTICALRIQDLDYQREEIHIEKQKNKNAAILPLTPALANTLKEYTRKWMPDAKPTDFVFPSITGEKISVSGLDRGIGAFCRSRGVKPHGVHSIRHNFARAMIVNGGGEYRLQKYLQHSTIAMSSHYVKLFNEDLKKDAIEFSPLDVVKRSKPSKFKRA